MRGRNFVPVSSGQDEDDHVFQSIPSGRAERKFRLFCKSQHVTELITKYKKILGLIR